MSYTLAYTGAEIDALLGKIDAIFVAEYGSTIYSEVTAAIAAGNKVIVANAGKVFVYAGTDDNSGYVFTQSGPNAAKPNATYVTLSTGNVWSTATVDLATLQQFYASLMEDTASGSIASFPDGAENVPVKELTADIEPIQDLHGYSNPWPAGSGKNKLKTYTRTEIKAANTNGTWSGDNYAVGGVTFACKFSPVDERFSYADMSGTNGGSQVLLWVSSAVSELVGDYYLNGGISNGLYITGQKNGTWIGPSSVGDDIAIDGLVSTDTFRACCVVNANKAASGTFKPMLRLKTEADATFAPYSNICPISGYTGAEIPVTGINVWDEETEVGGIFVSNGTNNNAATDRLRTKNYIPVVPETTYYINSDKWNHACGYDQDKNFVRAVPWTQSGAGYLILVPAGVYYIRLEFSSSYGTTYQNNISINYPSTDTGYHAYNGTVYSVSWSDHGTVYKGLMKYKGDGEWEITKTHESVDAGTVTWGATSTAWTQCTNITDAKPFANASVATVTSSAFIADSANNVYGRVKDNSIAVSSAGVVQIYAPALLVGSLTSAQVAEALSGVQILYELATPVTFTVSGPDPETLLGQNNMWSNTGDISVKYRANTALYIEKKLGE